MAETGKILFPVTAVTELQDSVGYAGNCTKLRGEFARKLRSYQVCT